MYLKGRTLNRWRLRQKTMFYVTEFLEGQSGLVENLQSSFVFDGVEKLGSEDEKRFRARGWNDGKDTTRNEVTQFFLTKSTKLTILR